MTDSSSTITPTLETIRKEFPPQDREWVEHAKKRFKELHLDQDQQLHAFKSAAATVAQTQESAEELFGLGSEWATEQINHAVENRSLQLTALSERTTWHWASVLLANVAGGCFVCGLGSLMGFLGKPYPVLLWAVVAFFAVLSGVSDYLHHRLAPHNPVVAALLRGVVRTPPLAAFALAIISPDWVLTQLQHLPGPVTTAIWPWWVGFTSAIVAGGYCVIRSVRQRNTHRYVRSDNQWRRDFRHLAFHRWQLSPRTIKALVAEITADAKTTQRTLHQMHGQPADFLAGVTPIYRDNRITLPGFDSVPYVVISAGYLIWVHADAGIQPELFWVVMVASVGVIASVQLARSIHKTRRLYRVYRYQPELPHVDQTGANLVDHKENFGTDECGTWGTAAYRELLQTLPDRDAQAAIAPLVNRARQQGRHPDAEYGQPVTWAQEYLITQQHAGHIQLRLRRTQHLRGWLSLWGIAALVLVVTYLVAQAVLVELARPGTGWMVTGVGIVAGLWVTARIWRTQLRRRLTGTAGYVAPTMVNISLYTVAVPVIWWCGQQTGPVATPVLLVSVAIWLICAGQWRARKHPLNNHVPTSNADWEQRLRAIMVDGLGYLPQDVAAVMGQAHNEAGAESLSATHGLPQHYLSRLGHNPEPVDYTPESVVLPVFVALGTAWLWWQFTLTGWGIALAVVSLLIALVGIVSAFGPVGRQEPLTAAVADFIEHRQHTSSEPA